MELPAGAAAGIADASGGGGGNAERCCSKSTALFCPCCKSPAAFKFSQGLLQLAGAPREVMLPLAAAATVDGFFSPRALKGICSLIWLCLSCSAAAAAVVEDVPDCKLANWKSLCARLETADPALPLTCSFPDPSSETRRLSGGCATTIPFCTGAYGRVGCVVLWLSADGKLVYLLELVKLLTQAREVQCREVFSWGGGRIGSIGRVALRGGVGNEQRMAAASCHSQER